VADHEHRYSAELSWTGNNGDGTAHYERYGRGYSVRMPGKPDLAGSADAAFRGDATHHSPEDLLLAAIAGCHMLSYLALCARSRICVLAYGDRAEAVMETTPDGGGRFTSATLHPRVVIQDATQRERAQALHDKAHAQCFIASSCNFPIRHEAIVEVEGDDAATMSSGGAA
jgi:organic hydroperoxide reductase OsmC/OhrA